MIRNRAIGKRWLAVSDAVRRLRRGFERCSRRVGTSQKLVSAHKLWRSKGTDFCGFQKWRKVGFLHRADFNLLSG
jgi:hypothetical protein